MLLNRRCPVSYVVVMVTAHWTDQSESEGAKVSEPLTGISGALLPSKYGVTGA